MKKNITIIVLALIFLAPALSLAANPQGLKTEIQAKRDTLKAEMQKRQEEKKATIEAKKTELKTALDEKMKLRAEFKTKLTEERCKRIQERVDSKIALFEEKKKSHVAVYENIKKRISSIIEKASAKGYDTSKLKSDLIVLEEKITTFTNDYASYLSKIKGSKNFTCRHSEGDFKGELVEARALLKTVHADAQDIRNYVANTIKPDIKALKDQKLDSTTTDTESEAIK
jgi:hypothetical protein